MAEIKKIPLGSIVSTSELGGMIRARRKTHDMRQSDLAKAAGVGIRFISELENGKPTAEIQKVLQVVATLGLEMHVQKPHFKKMAKVLS